MLSESKISIRTKILAVLSGVVFLAVALYLYLASRVSYDDKMLLILELNQTSVRTLGAQSEAVFNRILDRLRILAAIHATGAHVADEVLPTMIGNDDDFLRIAIAEQSSDGPKWEDTTELGTWTGYLQLYAKEADYLAKIQARYPIPFDRVLKEGVWIRNSTLPEPDSPPVMTVATVVREPTHQPQVIYALLRLDRLLGSFVRSEVAQTYLTDSDGYILADSHAEKVSRGENVRTNPLIAAAMGSKVRSQVLKLAQGEEGEAPFLGAYYQVGVAGLIVASQIPLEEAFAAARILAKKSLLYALVVITAAFLVALFFSHSLTVPIERMVAATKRIAQGDFNLLVPISSRDELAVLAASFNSMSGNLRASHEKIQEYSRDLEKKVIERTVKLEQQNTAIKEAQEALVRTTRLASVGEIAGRAAHEVLNPLTNMSTRLEKMRNRVQGEGKDDLNLLREIASGWAGTYREKGAEGLLASLRVPSESLPGKTLLDEDLENLQAIATDSESRRNTTDQDIAFLMTEAGRINKIVNGMRQLTRVTGTRRLMDLHPFLDGVISTMSDLLAKHGIQVEKRYDERNSQIMADHDELLQVLSNLIRNSMQAILEARREGKPCGNPARVWVSTTVGERIEIRLSDNGPGIDPGLFERIFDASFTTKSVEEGTGLGLAIARRFIRAHEGDVTVEKSTPGVETTFLIELPPATEKG